MLYGCLASAVGLPQEGLRAYRHRLVAHISVAIFRRCNFLPTQILTLPDQLANLALGQIDDPLTVLFRSAGFHEESSVAVLVTSRAVSSSTCSCSPTLLSDGFAPSLTPPELGFGGADPQEAHTTKAGHGRNLLMLVNLNCVGRSFIMVPCHAVPWCNRKTTGDAAISDIISESLLPGVWLKAIMSLLSRKVLNARAAPRSFELLFRIGQL